MSSLGDLYFVLGLDDKKFNDAIKAAKEKIEGLGADVEVGINIDLNKVAKKVRDELAKLDGLTGGDKTIGLSVQVKEDTLNAVKSQLATLEAQRTVKLSVEYDNEKFQAVTTALKNYTDSLNNLGKIRLGIDDSFLRTGVSSTNGRGLKGFLGNMSDYLFGDDSGEVSKSIGQIQKVLNNYTFKLKAVIDEQLLINSLNAASKKKIPLNVGVNMDIAAIQKKLNALKVPLTFNSKQAIDDIKAKLKKETFKGKLELVIDKAKVSKAVKAALEKQGLNYNTTASDVRAKKIEEIQQRMNHRQAKFNGQVKKSTSSTNKLGSSMKLTADWAGQLANQFSNFISIYAIERFVRNLYTIGGEFQKQQIALRNMIGDVTQADSTFERLKDLAVKSPLTFSDLASYTKQMAAYGIEYDELYDTTKRLADISAGVGVDMGRLILAYGQVRSAEVLRGQELRQFTEAGIPLVAELAKRLEEVRGESVKVGEVFDAISKRQVSFEMVKDVLFDMTDPGGRFFAMQEELAKSLAGQWSNLKDAWDIMIADIANSSNNVLRGVAGVAADILRNWRGWVPVLSAIAAAIGVVTSAIRIYNTVATIANTITKASVWGIIASAILSAAGAIGGWAIAASVAEKNTSQVNTELEAQIQKWSENRSNALRYIDAIKSSNTSEERRIQLYNELLKLYPSIFENMKMEQLLLADTASLKTQVNDATKAMSIEEIAKLIKEERKKIREAEGNSVERGFFNGKEYKIQRKPLTAEQTAAIAKAEARIAELEARAAEIQKNINREGLINKLTPDSSIEKYIEVYHKLAKAVKILRQGGIKGEISNPKEFTTTLEYYDQLSSALEEQEAISKKFKIGTPERADADRLAKVYRDAISAIGGIWDTSKGRKGASDAAKLDINAYIEAIKNEIARISKQWDLFKDLMDASGDRTLSANIAFGGQITFDNQLEQLKSRIVEEAKKFGVGINLSDLLGLGEKQLLEQGVSEKAAKAIGALIEAYNKENQKLKDESVRNFIEILNASKDFEQQIADIERELQRDLADLRKTGVENDMPKDTIQRKAEELIRKAEEKKANVRFEEFKESSDWVKVFDDLDRVSTPTLDSMLAKMEDFVSEIEESPEAMKELLKAIGDMREKLSERDPFGSFARSLEKLNNIKAARWLLAGNKEYTFQQDLYGFKKGQTITPEILDNLEQGAVDDFNMAVDGTSKAFENLKNVLSPLIQLFGDGESVIGGFLEGIGNALSAASNTGSSLEGLMKLKIGKDKNKNLGSLLGIENAGIWGAAAGFALSAISSIAQAHDKRLDKAINKSKLEVEKLKNAYSDIQRLVERQLGSQTTTQSRAMIASLNKQRLELQKQYRLEDEKKKTDQSKLEDYKQQIKELDDQIKYFYEDLANEQYGVDIKDWASQISEALTEAFASGEDAAKAFYDTVAEILRSLATEAIRLQFIEPAMANLRNYMFGTNGVFTTSSANGTDLSESELVGLNAELDKLKGQIEASNDYWDRINDAVGGILDAEESSEKGGLSKEVKGETEETANLRNSYLNAMRQDLSVNRTMIEKLIGDDVPKMNYLAEAQLQQLQMIVSNTKRNADAADKIFDLVNRVVDKGNNRLKV